MRRLFLNRLEPAKKSGQNIPKNRYRTTIAERMMETLAELPFIGDQVSRAGESHPRARITGREALTSSGSHCPATPLQKPPMGEQPWWSPRNASDPMRCVPPRASQENGFALSTGFLPSPVDPRAELNNSAPSLQLHYRTFITTTSCPAPGPASVLSSSWGPPIWTSPFASGRQVPTFRARARFRVTPPLCRMPSGPQSGHPPDSSRGNDLPPVSTSSISFRHVISGLLALVSLSHT